MSAALTIHGLEVRYGSRVALTGVDLSIPAGSSLAVIGPNGSGKSTLLRAIAGLVPIAAGTIERPEGQSIAFVLQSTDVDRSLPITVRDTVAMGRYATLGLIRRFRAADRHAVDDALHRLDLVPLAHRPLHELSGGQRQRTLVAQGLAQQADLLLLDEPASGVDVLSRQAILDAIDTERDAGRCVVVTTHDLADARRCDLVLVVAARQVAFGPPEQVVQLDELRRAFGTQIVQLGSELHLDDAHHGHPPLDHDHAHP